MYRILVSPGDLLDTPGVADLLKRRSIELMPVEPRGFDLLAAARQQHPHLIVFTSELGDTTPAEVCAAVRGDAELAQVQLLMLSETIGDDDSGRAQTDALLVCPVEDAQLLQTIGTLLHIGVRGAPRVAVELLGRAVGLAEEGGEGAATVINILNISATGMLAEAPEHFQVGAEGTLRFFLPGASAALDVGAVVRGLTDEVKLHYGLEFRGLTAENQAAIEGFIREQLAEAGASTGA